jgi:hypothetical protein
MIEIFENFIPEEQRARIEELFFSNKFPWYFFQKSVDIANYDPNKFYSPGVLRHCFVLDGKMNSEWASLLDPLLEQMSQTFGKRIRLIQCHSNLMMPSVSLTDRLDLPHIDINNSGQDCFTAIYYLHDSNAETTVFENTVEHNLDIDLNSLKIQKMIPSKKNSLAVWPNKFVHSAPSAVLSPRAVINFNLYK